MEAVHGFVEQVREDAPGAALDGPAASAIARAGAMRWNVDLRQFNEVEQGQERRPSRPGRPHLHLRTHIRNLKEGRYRLRLVVQAIG